MHITLIEYLWKTLTWSFFRIILACMSTPFLQIGSVWLMDYGYTDLAKENSICCLIDSFTLVMYLYGCLNMMDSNQNFYCLLLDAVYHTKIFYLYWWYHFMKNRKVLHCLLGLELSDFTGDYFCCVKTQI